MGMEKMKRITLAVLAVLAALALAACPAPAPYRPPAPAPVVRAPVNPDPMLKSWAAGQQVGTVAKDIAIESVVYTHEGAVRTMTVTWKINTTAKKLKATAESVGMKASILGDFCANDDTVRLAREVPDLRWQHIFKTNKGAFAGGFWFVGIENFGEPVCLKAQAEAKRAKDKAAAVAVAPPILVPMPYYPSAGPSRGGGSSDDEERERGENDGYEGNDPRGHTDAYKEGYEQGQDDAEAEDNGQVSE